MYVNTSLINPILDIKLDGKHNYKPLIVLLYIKKLETNVNYAFNFFILFLNKVLK